MKPSIFNNPHSMSFKDFLACTMCGPFVWAVIHFMANHITADLDLIKTLIPVVVVVLGGYFGQEVASSYFTRGNTGYSGYGTGYGYTSTLAATTAPEQNQEGVI